MECSMYVSGFAGQSLSKDCYGNIKKTTSTSCLKHLPLRLGKKVIFDAANAEESCYLNYMEAIC